MIDDNWEMVAGNAAHEIEVLNYSNQVNVIEALVHLLMHHYKGPDGACLHYPAVAVLKEFHRTATLFLLHQPGEFRDSEVVVKKGDGTVVHTPPPATDVADHVSKFFAEIDSRWLTNSPAEIGAYALWMINWIHPFKNGNGRTARAFCYACICLKYGFTLPGSPTVIDLIMQNRAEYQDALKAADTAYEATGTPDLVAIVDFVDRLIAEQISSIS
ncbi:Fic family protein [Sphingomonas sp.]|uniref:Fic family protein n=1 Tax=Sphingomonas sp. TaxID=28214 RepID=UPI00307D3E2E